MVAFRLSGISSDAIISPVGSCPGEISGDCLLNHAPVQPFNNIISAKANALEPVVRRLSIVRMVTIVRLSINMSQLMNSFSGIESDSNQGDALWCSAYLAPVARP